jgi:hypothetical protein
MSLTNYKWILLGLVVVVAAVACQKAGTVPSASAPAALTIVDAIPNSYYPSPVINTTSAIQYFYSAAYMGYGGFLELSPPAGNDTVYVVDYNNDTLDISPKSANLLFYGLLKLNVGGIYSLFLTGADTSSPDYLFTTDTLPYHSPLDSTVGVRFVNLSTGSAPMSINLEGSPDGSEVTNLPYKGITGFKKYISNSTVTNNSSAYIFVIRDAATGDSLCYFGLSGIGNGNGVGLTDPNNNNPLTFKNITIAIYGSENLSSNNPLSVMVIDDY